jgi:hypothetical protein
MIVLEGMPLHANSAPKSVKAMAIIEVERTQHKISSNKNTGSGAHLLLASTHNSTSNWSEK